jgi:hypothetical protein
VLRLLEILLSKENNYVQLHSLALLKALQKRKEYFQSLTEKEKENALKFQEFIDSELKKAGNQNNRLSVIQGLMKEHLKELHKESSLLSKSMINFSKSLKELNKMT